MNNITAEINRANPHELLKASEEDILEYLLDKWLLSAVEESPDRGPEGSDNNDIYYVNIRIYLVPTPYISRTIVMKPMEEASEIVFSPTLNYDEHTSTMQFSVHSARLSEALNLTRKRLESLNSAVLMQTPRFISNVREAVRNHRTGLERQRTFNRSAIVDAGVRLVRRTDAIEPVSLQVKQEVRLLRAEPAHQTGSADERLSRESLIQVLTLVEQAGRGLQLTPALYCGFGEEDLRMIIVGFLNAVFERPAASGETFSVSGKTDILLNIPGGAVLIGECLWWRGAAPYIAKMEQLFTYVAFHHTAAMMITFSRQVSLIRVVEKATAALHQHASRRGDIGKSSPTRCTSLHEHPRDPEKSIEIHHLFFNLRHPGGAVRGSGTQRRRQGS